MKKKTIVLAQLGSPKSPSTKDVRLFLKEFLGDPRVVDLPRFFWWIILNFFVLPFRPARSAALYKRIWDGGSFPLIRLTEEMARHLQEEMKDHANIEVVYLLGEKKLGPLIDKQEDNWREDLSSFNETSWLILPLFPQYSESTTASVVDAVSKELHQRVLIPSFEFIAHFYSWPSFIESSARQIKEVLEEREGGIDSTERLLISFHGIPKRRVIQKNDAYFRQCLETFYLIKEELLHQGVEVPMSYCFQSRFGSEEWLTPYTEEMGLSCIERGEKKLAIFSPSFAVDCLETIDELGHELKNELAERGGELLFIPSLNSKDFWVKSLARDLKDHLSNTLTVKILNEEHQRIVMTQKVEQEVPPLSKEAKESLKIVFFTLFLDLMGFSIIFPLFPSLASHYVQLDGGNFFIQLIFDMISFFSSSSLSSTPVLNAQTIVLFGGILGALYSFLQFLAAPFWGSISDRYGRRPVLLISLAGLLLSYILWFFSGSFTLLIFSRLIGGLMSGNISVASAVVADVTEEKNRSKGMAFIGMAFGLGFIFGPAIGGLLSLVDLTNLYPLSVEMGINPFSMPALGAALLTFLNLFLVLRFFKETNKEQHQAKISHPRSINPLVLFKPLPYANVNLVNFGHFFFLFLFSGMEFTLTFFAAEKLGFNARQNALMFVFIGLVLAFTQGGYVRRKAASVGEKKMSLQGLFLVMIGLFCLSFTTNKMLLYTALFFLATGGAMVIPCLTALASLLLPKEVQGRGLGLFRSLGALARVVGPLLLSVIYWKIGSSSLYLIVAVLFCIPLLFISKIKQVKKNSDFQK